MQATAAILALTICALVAACDRGPSCTEYADHLAEVMTQGLEGADRESRMGTVRSGALTACENGRVDEAERTCVLGATAREQMTECAMGSKK